jgi:hypothetical protein
LRCLTHRLVAFCGMHDAAFCNTRPRWRSWRWRQRRARHRPRRFPAQRWEAKLLELPSCQRPDRATTGPLTRGSCSAGGMRRCRNGGRRLYRSIHKITCQTCAGFENSWEKLRRLAHPKANRAAKTLPIGNYKLPTANRPSPCHLVTLSPRHKWRLPF